MVHCWQSGSSSFRYLWSTNGIPPLSVYAFIILMLMTWVLKIRIWMTNCLQLTVRIFMIWILMILILMVYCWQFGSASFGYWWSTIDRPMLSVWVFIVWILMTWILMFDCWWSIAGISIFRIRILIVWILMTNHWQSNVFSLGLHCLNVDDLGTDWILMVDFWLIAADGPHLRGQDIDGQLFIVQIFMVQILMVNYCQSGSSYFRYRWFG